jgi:hypothetical protein
MTKKTDIIKNILDYYRENTKKDDDFYLEKFEYLSTQTEGRLKSYLKVLENLEK